ncbi:tRNA lysidine(34) synthetase TilS [uncultured Sulfitobacter sp.]|uniref:tRNA lysidine(34) synthetase TilS n=1 Tax=uncultured Sulfitobacter sp. TaxID=191468 RepID=UPI002615158C|nr:tRNA lysidine(34) synthetase TilS [uncultured Sulfitobacter sp.]
MDPLEEAVSATLGATDITRLGVAVSGGSDSVALLTILHRIADAHSISLSAVTVDHGLRPGSAREAESVKDLCKTSGINHQTLRWEGWDGTGNLQNAARDARYALMGVWAKSLQLDAVALGHTAEDQAETVLMRLKRRAGVDGLCAMARQSERGGMVWLRPLLDQRRGALQDYLAARSIEWVSDSSNEDLRFDRVRARKALSMLGNLGIDVPALSAVAQNMADARAALRHATQAAVRDSARLVQGGVAIDAAKLAMYPREIRRRLWIHALGWIAEHRYPPRRATVDSLMEAAKTEKQSVGAGCAVIKRRDTIWLFRESERVRDTVCDINAAWDGRWHVTRNQEREVNGPYEIRALGDKGLKQCDKWRSLDLPRGLLLGHPALWHGDTVISSPCAKPHQNWRWTLKRDEKAFFDTPL